MTDPFFLYGREIFNKSKHWLVLKNGLGHQRHETVFWCEMILD